jgi:serine protease Do
MTAASPLKVLADAIRTTADAAATGVLQVRARGGRPATAAHVGSDLAVAPLHALDRDEGLVIVRGEQTLDAAVAGRDEALDLVLLRVTGLGASPLVLAEVVADPAQLVVAVARSWQGDLMARLASIIGHTCPLRRWRAEPLPALLRTDLQAGRGVSGGVLVDPDGQIQAWLTTGLSRGSVVGIPASLLSERIGRLATHGRIRRGYVGMAVQPVLLPPPQQAHGRHGLLVSGLEADGPASGAGLYVGDVLIAANGQALVEPGVLQGLLVEALIGSALQLQVLRATTIHDIAVIVGERAR